MEDLINYWFDNYDALKRGENPMEQKPTQHIAKLQKEFICELCNNNYNEDDMVCYECGYVFGDYLETKIVYMEGERKPLVHYERVNYWKEFINQKQGTSRKYIPRLIYKTIRRSKATTREEITHILKKYKWQKKYGEHVYKIMLKLKLISPVFIMPVHFYQLTSLFQDIEGLSRHIKEFKNKFFNYSWLFRKLCDKLQIPEYKHLAKEIKYKISIRRQEKLWSLLTKEEKIKLRKYKENDNIN